MPTYIEVTGVLPVGGEQSLQPYRFESCGDGKDDQVHQEEDEHKQDQVPVLQGLRREEKRMSALAITERAGSDHS